MRSSERSPRPIRGGGFGGGGRTRFLARTEGTFRNPTSIFHSKKKGWSSLGFLENSETRLITSPGWDRSPKVAGLARLVIKKKKKGLWGVGDSFVSLRGFGYSRAGAARRPKDSHGKTATRRSSTSVPSFMAADTKNTGSPWARHLGPNKGPRAALKGGGEASYQGTELLKNCGITDAVDHLLDEGLQAEWEATLLKANEVGTGPNSQPLFSTFSVPGFRLTKHRNAWGV